MCAHVYMFLCTCVCMSDSVCMCVPAMPRRPHAHQFSAIIAVASTPGRWGFDFTYSILSAFITADVGYFVIRANN